MKKVRVTDIVYNHKRCFILINKAEASENIFENVFRGELEFENNIVIPIEIDIFKRYKLQGEYAWILQSKTDTIFEYIDYPFKEENVYLNINK
jgi:hypothetical protein